MSARGTEPDSSKVEAVRDFATPTSLTDVRAFLGLASYYRRFIKNFPDIAAPLHDLTKGGQEFSWTSAADQAFNDLKNRLCSAPILSQPDFSLPFTIHTDASYFGLGAVLSQRRGENEKVIAYASQTLTLAERNYSTTEKECLAIVWTVNYWRPYLLGKAFDIVTDHQSLTWLQGLKEPKGRLARWILALQEYEFEIKDRPGWQHSNADTLSISSSDTLAGSRRSRGPWLDGRGKGDRSVHSMVQGGHSKGTAGWSKYFHNTAAVKRCLWSRRTDERPATS